MWGEFKRRKVIRVGIAYAVVAWLTLQIVDVIGPLLELPIWVGRAVLVFLAVGLVVALIVAWAYELTPDGIRRTQDSTEAVPGSPASSKYDLAIVALLVVVIGLIVNDRFFPGTDTAEIVEEPGTQITGAASERSGKVSIAVLPFLNLSDIAEQEHFADGLTEELLNSLAATDSLRVISRTSSFAFKGSPLDAREIAAQLNVEHILEGSVRRTGNMIRVTAQLIDAESDSHLWSRNFEDVVSAENVFRVQESIARLVTDSLQVRLMPRNMPTAPASIATLDLYFDGLFIFNEIKNGRDLSDANFTRAASKFEAALEAEPDWLPALVKLGQLHHWWSWGGSDTEKLQISRRHLTEALRRDPQNAAANGSMGYILWAEGDFEGSLEAYDKADLLGGDQDWARAITLSSLGRFDESVAAYRAAAQVHPVSLPLKGQLTFAMYCAGQYSAIVSNEDDLIASWPEGQEGVKSMLARSHARLGNRDKALAYVAELAQRRQTEAYFADILAAVGEPERARLAIDELVERSQGLVSAVTATLKLGEQDMALDLLERHLEEQLSAGSTRFLFCEPEIRALAGNPRYDAILQSRGLLPD
jgi:TolB-like protein/tetratricopeptide (TPR) repeat protein